MLILYILFSFL